MFATEKYTTLLLFLVFPRLRREFLLLKTCQIDVESTPFTSGKNLDSEKVHEDEMFEQQDILQFFSGESIIFKVFKIPTSL